MVLTQFGTKIESIRSNNALEFNMPDFYNSNGIVHQQSCVYILQQNSVVKRKHQQILAMARALQIQSNVPLAFWGDCVLTAVHLIKRLPSPLLTKSLYEILFNKAPSYSHLRTFVCLCYATNPSPHKHKFSPRATKSVFLGYPFNIKGYKLFDFESHSVFISRDVVFHETIFPCLPYPLFLHLLSLIFLCPLPLLLLHQFLTTLSSRFIMILMRKTFLVHLMLLLTLLHLLYLALILVHQILLILFLMSLEDPPDPLNHLLIFKLIIVIKWPQLTFHFPLA